MNRKPLVSIITIFLNAETFLCEAVESVLAQTYGHWELLLVDDGSVDGSTEIAFAYARQYPEQIRYFEHEDHRNLGMSASRNLGIRQARGEYVAFLDADDVYLPPKLEKQVAILQAHPEAAMIYGATQHWYSWKGRDEDRVRDEYRKLGVPPDTIIQPPQLIPLYLRHEAQTPGTCAVLVRRQAIESVGGFEESFRGMFEDQVFFYKLCLRYPIFVEGGSWDRYRQWSDSHTRQARKQGKYAARGPNLAYGTFLRWLWAYLDAQNISHPELERILHREMLPYRNRLNYRIAVALHRFAGVRRRVAQRLKSVLKWF